MKRVLALTGSMMLCAMSTFADTQGALSQPRLARSNPPPQDWERVKLKVQIMGVFHEQKTTLLSSDEWNQERKKQLEAAAASIALRAKLLQKTARL